MTAIAAVVAFTAAPAFAQSADAASDGAAPVAIAPPPAPVASDTAAAQSSAQPVLLTPPPVTASTTSALAADEARAAPNVVKHTATKARATAPTPAAPATIIDHAAAPAVAKAAPVPAPIAPAPIPTTAAKVQPPVQTAAVQKSTATATPGDRSATDDELIAAAGLGIVLLAGGAYAYSRRRRDDEGYGEVVETVPVAARVPAARDDVDYIAPIAASPAMSIPAPAPLPDVAATALPPEFDLSRYSPRVQAAYRGPTTDNPSHSLKRRLARARFFDQRDRREAGVTRSPAETVSAAPLNNVRGEQLVYRPARPNVRPQIGGFQPARRGANG
ncbi:MAG: hypothetical protein JOY99_16195 [Sphingomonadaceae bacterium]|nr:hypothetical protein [Sphingomonadaceae bacterium]